MKILFYLSEGSLYNFFISTQDYVNFDNKYEQFANTNIDGYHLLDRQNVPHGFDLEKDFNILTDGYSGYREDGYNIFVVADMLSPIKRRAYTIVDGYASELISQGFLYDGVTFSLSSNAQTKWNGFFASKDLRPYPFEVPNIDDSESYSVTSSTVVENMYLAGVSKVEASLVASNNIKAQIRSANTKEEIVEILNSIGKGAVII